MNNAWDGITDQVGHGLIQEIKNDPIIIKGGGGFTLIFL